MIACLCQATSLDQDEESIYADFNAEVFNKLIETQFSNIVKLMSGLGMSESIQEKVLKELSTNLASLMVMENWKDEAGWSDYPTNSSQSDTLPQFRQFLHNKPIDVKYYVLPLGTILSENITYFCSIVAFLNEVFFLN